MAMAITVLENYVSVGDYALKCGIGRKSVLNRIKAGTISAIKVDGILAINIQANPPRRFIHHTWKKGAGGIHRPHPELRAVISWCNSKDIRCYPYLRAIITGKIEAWVIAGEVFARASDLAAFVK
jgi:hypothetical protein